MAKADQDEPRGQAQEACDREQRDHVRVAAKRQCDAFRGADAPAVNAKIISALSYMVLASRNAPTVIGLATDDEATWIRIETALRALIQGVYGAQAR